MEVLNRTGSTLDLDSNQSFRSPVILPMDDNFDQLMDEIYANGTRAPPPSLASKSMWTWTSDPNMWAMISILIIIGKFLIILGKIG